LSWISSVFNLCAALKDLKREGWVRRGVQEPESVADHSYSLALLAMLAAAERGLDPLRAAALAVIHDLAEAVLGDLTPSEKEARPHYEEGERRVIEEVVEKLPEQAGSLLQKLYDEYASQSSEEARLVKQLDKLEMALQAARYEAEKRGKEGLAEEFKRSALNAVTDSTLRGVIDREME